jgi:hypothetical protein
MPDKTILLGGNALVADAREDGSAVLCTAGDAADQFGAGTREYNVAAGAGATSPSPSTSLPAGTNTGFTSPPQRQ